MVGSGTPRAADTFERRVIVRRLEQLDIVQASTNEVLAHIFGTEHDTDNTPGAAGVNVGRENLMPGTARPDKPRPAAVLDSAELILSHRGFLLEVEVVPPLQVVTPFGIVGGVVAITKERLQREKRLWVLLCRYAFGPCFRLDLIGERDHRVKLVHALLRPRERNLVLGKLNTGLGINVRYVAVLVLCLKLWLVVVQMHDQTNRSNNLPKDWLALRLRGIRFTHGARPLNNRGCGKCTDRAELTTASISWPSVDSLV